jgi:hypothetical protein
MSQQTATLTLGHELASRGSKRTFARHFGEMVLAMFLGMACLEVLRSWPSSRRVAACRLSRAASRSCSWAST